MVVGGGALTQPLLGGQDKKEKLSLPRLCALTISFLGVQFGWACQVAFTTPIFLELGLSQFWVSFVWLAGPISGLLVQPTVGVLSDRNTSKWGRRRPFIFFGSIAILIGMISISNASTLGRWFGDKEHHNPAAIVIAIVGFWILDLANNTVQGPCRALLMDVAPLEQQNLGGSLFSFMLGVGNLAGYFTGSRNLVSVFPFFVTNLRALFSIGMVNLVVCISITLLTVKETPLTEEEVKLAGKVQNPFVEIFWGIVRMPSAMRRVCIVQFVSWLAWFTYLLYMSAWVGYNIYHGNPDSSDQALVNRFDEGVRAAALGMTINAGITMGVSLILPKLADFVGIKPIYCVAQLLLAVCLSLTIWVETEVGALILIAACGIPWAVVMVFPFTLVSMAVDVTEAGKYMGVLNIFVVIPQICVSVGIGGIIKLFHNNLASALGAGGIAAVVSAGLVWTLVVKKQVIEELPIQINVDSDSPAKYGSLD